MFSWLAHRIVSFQMARLREGDLRPVLIMDAPDVRLDFPGENSWAPGARGKADHERWLRRFVEVGMQIQPDEVIVKGFPWRQTMCVRGTDHLPGPDGENVYENRYVMWGRLVWGRLKEYEVYEDTQRSKALDAWLEQNQPVAETSARPAPAQ